MGVCARECACVRACARVFTHQRPCLLGGVSGRGLLLGEGELQGLSCQVAGSICQLFAHCLPIGDLLQVLK